MRDGSQPHQRMRHRQMVFFNKRDDFLARTGRDDAATYDGHRLLRLDDLRCSLSRTDAEVCIRTAMVFRLRIHRRVIHLCKEEVPRDIDKDRPRTSMACQGKGLAHRRHEEFRILDLEIMLRDGHGDIKDIRLLEGVTTQERGIDLPREGYDRDGIHESRRKPCDEIRRPRA